MGPGWPAHGPTANAPTLAGASACAVAKTPAPPLAVIALTDGAANENADNARALSSLLEARIPFVGVGFGSDLGVRTLSLRQVDAPAVAAPNSDFYVSAQLEMMNTEEMPAFDLVLFRDGQMHERKSVTPGKGSRTWRDALALVHLAITKEY